jgi:hypothetical protein
MRIIAAVVMLALLAGVPARAQPVPAAAAISAAEPARPAAAERGVFLGTLKFAADALDGVITAAIQVVRRGISLVAGAEWTVAHDLHGFARRISDDLESFEELVERAGFRLVQIDRSIALVPGIQFTFDLRETISAEEDAKLRAELAALSGVGAALTRLVIVTLLDLDEAMESVRPAGFRLSQIQMSIAGVLPEISVSFTR